jgi:hypothetical protein
MFSGTLYAEGGVPVKYNKGSPGVVEIESTPKEVRIFENKLVFGR